MTAAAAASGVGTALAALTIQLHMGAAGLIIGHAVLGAAGGTSDAPLLLLLHGSHLLEAVAAFPAKQGIKRQSESSFPF